MASDSNGLRSSNELLSLNRERRTIHKLGRDQNLKKDLVVNILQQVLLLAPSFFNSQSTRMVLLLDADNRKLWDLVVQCLVERSAETTLPAETTEKLCCFREANGTVIYTAASLVS